MNARLVLAWLRAAGVSKTVYSAVALYCVAVGGLDPDTLLGKALFGTGGFFDVRVWAWGHVISGRVLAASLLLVAVVVSRAVANGPFSAAVDRLLSAVLSDGDVASPAAAPKSIEPETPWPRPESVTLPDAKEVPHA